MYKQKINLNNDNYNCTFSFWSYTQLNYMLGLAKRPPDFNSLNGIFNC